MRGQDDGSGTLFSYIDLEDRVPAPPPPLRLIRGIVNEVLGTLSGEFEALYSHMGRPSIPPEKLLRSSGDTILNYRHIPDPLRPVVV